MYVWFCFIFSFIFFRLILWKVTQYTSLFCVIPLKKENNVNWYEWVWPSVLTCGSRSHHAAKLLNINKSKKKFWISFCDISHWVTHVACHLRPNVEIFRLHQICLILLRAHPRMMYIVNQHSYSPSIIITHVACHMRPNSKISYPHQIRLNML